MSTLLSTVIATARTHLNETTAAFWTDAELLTHAVDGAKDLWRAIVNLQQGHFSVINDADVSLAASATSLTGVPADCFRVEVLEPVDLTNANPVQNLTFSKRRMSDADFQSARSLSAQDPNGQEIFFDLLNAGAPVGAPTIVVAPQITAAIDLRLVYTQTLGTLTTASANPIPGESDHALVAFIVAHALAKQNPKQIPDATWLQVYATDKANLLSALTPRETQDLPVADAIFEAWAW